MKNFKKNTFELVLNTFNKFYVHVLPLESVVLGKRGFVNDEESNGLVLVFSDRRSYKNLDWDNEYIFADMRFSGNWEYIVIPFNSVSAIFDDPVKPGFIFKFSDSKLQEDFSEEKSDTQSTKIMSKKDNIVKVDFNKKGE